MAVVDALLLPLASQPCIDRVGGTFDILGIDVPTDAEGVEVPQPPLARTPQSMRQEVAVVMAKDHIGNDLGLGGVFLDLLPGTEAIVRSDSGQQVIQAGGAKPRPLAAGEEDISRNDEDILASTHRKSLVRLVLDRRFVAVAIGWFRGRRGP